MGALTLVIVILLSCELGGTLASVLMAMWRELLEFERGMIVGARQMGNSISDVVCHIQNGGA